MESTDVEGIRYVFTDLVLIVTESEELECIEYVSTDFVCVIIP